MIKRTKLKLGVIIIVLAGLCAGIVAYRQLKAPNPSGRPAEVLDSTSNQQQEHPAAKKFELEVREWGIKILVPAEYSGDLHYLAGNLKYEQSPATSMLPPGDYASFSFKSIAADYQKCAASNNLVALLYRGASAPKLQPELYTAEFIKSIGNYSYSYILPRQACIEGSFPYHEQHRQLYDQFRASFPGLVETLEPVRA